MANFNQQGIAGIMPNQYPYTNNLIMNTPYDNYLGRNNVTANLMTKANVDLAALQEDATQKGYDVSDTVQAAKYIAKYGMASSPQSQCTRGISMFMQLASYAKGKAKHRYYQRS